MTWRVDALQGNAHLPTTTWHETEEEAMAYEAALWFDGQRVVAWWLCDGPETREDASQSDLGPETVADYTAVIPGPPIGVQRVGEVA